MFENISPTKREIYYAAIELFFKRGYNDVSMRDLAKLVGITNAAIYNHFESKKDILTGLFQTYTNERHKILPGINKMMQLIGEKHPHEILMMADYHFSSDIGDSMSRILSIGASGVSTDEDCRRFIFDNVFITPKETTVPVLNRMIELGVIEPFNVDTFENIMAHYCFSAVALWSCPPHIVKDRWKDGLSALFEAFVKPIEK